MISSIRIHLRDSVEESLLVRRRLFFTVGIISVLAACLLARLVYLQLFQYGYYNSLSRDNRISLVAIPPARGLIYDRNGVLLAQNVVAHNIEVYPDRSDDLEQTLDALAQVVLLSDSDIARFHQARESEAPGNRVVLRSGLADDEVARFAVNRHRFPGVEIVSRLQRQYPYGELTAHSVGYVGRISRDDQDSIDPGRYKNTDYIGRLGLEARYEDDLLGSVGFEEVEINAHGRIVGLLRRKKPDAGVDLHLAFDLGLQRAAMEALGERRGAVVALEPASGDVLAFASTPSYDPNLFIGGIDDASYREVSESEQKPLLNRALHGRYSPGSVIKSAIGMAGLHHGFGLNTEVDCPGWFTLPDVSRRFRCWKKEGHEAVTMIDAIVQSCDVYYYKLADFLGIERISPYLSAFGLGRLTGIDVDGESAGLLPSVEWKRRTLNEPWYRGETANIGIGQGAMLMTPLQMAAMAATLANRGIIMRPRLVTALGAGGGERRELEPLQSGFMEADPEHYQAIIGAMEEVVHGEHGTARFVSQGLSYRIAGKTGTAQVISMDQEDPIPQEELEERFRDHALFIAFAPVEAPRIAIAVIIENGGKGSSVAAPVAREVMDHYLLRWRPQSIATADNDSATRESH